MAYPTTLHPHLKNHRGNGVEPSRRPFNYWIVKYEFLKVADSIFLREYVKHHGHLPKPSGSSGKPERVVMAFRSLRRLTFWRWIS